MTKVILNGRDLRYNLDETITPKNGRRAFHECGNWNRLDPNTV